MTAAQAEALCGWYPEHAARVFTLRHFCSLLDQDARSVGADGLVAALQAEVVRDHAVADPAYDFIDAGSEEFGAILNLADQILVAVDHLARSLWPPAAAPA